MARSSKRPAEIDVDDSEEEHSRSASEDPSSTPPSGSRKRRRISNDSILEEEDRDREDTPPSEYESELDEDDELAATQAIRQKRAEKNNNGPAECGILESVALQNFMCHENYEFKLGPLINFVCGENGSGKSAILTAIVLCLGGKASATNRGGSLKSFIKEGTENARIVCKIKNQGEGAYMPEEYGNTIIIERHFSKHGTSGFKIRSDSGRIISSKKSDLDEICDHFALQIDNPLNVLSQDMARQFISTSNAAEKYRFFVKGVQLEQLDQDYRLIEEQLENIKFNIEQKRPDIKDLERAMEKAKAKDDAMKRKESGREKLRDLRRQIAWVQVREQEGLLEDYCREIESADVSIQEAEEQVGRLEQAYQASDVADGAAKDAYTNAQTTLQEIQDEKKEKQARLSEYNTNNVEATTELRNIKSALDHTITTISGKMEEIANEERRLIELRGPGPAERLKDLREAQHELKEAVENLENHNAGSGAVKQQRLYYESELQERAKETDAKRLELSKREASLNNFRKSQGQVYGAYDRNMPNLLKAIEQEQRFQQRPVGPIGKHVRLLKPEWSSILEKSLGNSLNGFIVTSKDDSSLLNDLMRRVRCHVPILIGNNHPLDIRGHEPDASFDTVLRVLEIDNDLVRKQLIVQNMIEQTILIPDLEQAMSVMFDHDRLVNVKRCFSLNIHDKRKGHALSYGRAGGPCQDPVKEYFGEPRMKSNNEAQIRLREEAVEEARKDLRTAERENQRATEAFVKAKQAVGKHNKREGELKLIRQALEDRVESLTETIKDDNVESGRLEALRMALTEAQDQKALNEGMFKDATVNADEKRKQLREAKKDLATAEEKVADCQRAQTAAQQSAARADKKRAYDLGEFNSAIARVDDARRDRAGMEAKRSELEVKVNDFTHHATLVSARVNIPEGATHQSLRTQYESLQAEIQRFQRQMGGTDQEIAAAARAARDAFKKGKRDLENLENLGEKLTTSLRERQQRWKKFRSHISVRAKAMFTYLLSERSFRGRLITDHKQKLLELSVEPDITKSKSTGRNARTLSGGEKSFSQICLLLSIWEAMGSPIRCLDEFDVFMDAVNRNLSVNLLVEAARQSVGRQFVLISPGTKSDIQRADDINAIEVAKPERGQRTLNEAGFQRIA